MSYHVFWYCHDSVIYSQLTFICHGLIQWKISRQSEKNDGMIHRMITICHIFIYHHQTNPILSHLMILKFQKKQKTESDTGSPFYRARLQQGRGCHEMTGDFFSKKSITTDYRLATADFKLHIQISPKIIIIISI